MFKKEIYNLIVKPMERVKMIFKNRINLEDTYFSVQNLLHRCSSSVVTQSGTTITIDTHSNEKNLIMQKYRFVLMIG